MKKKNFLFSSLACLSLGILITLIVFSCQKVTHSSVVPSSDVSSSYNNSKIVNANFSGKVTSESGTPLAGVEVTIGNNKAVTDQNGSYLFSNIQAFEKAQVVIFTKDGFHKGFKTHLVNANKNNYVVIRMLAKDNAQTFDAKNGATIDVYNKASIVFMPNSIMNEATKQVYNGQVKVFAKVHSTDNPNISQTMPGALRGINTGGEEVGLFTFGMLTVELEDMNGNKLQIATGKTAEIHMKILANKSSATPPNTIPLWHLNESNGLWVEEGSAKNTEGEFVGNVSHFSNWNYDVPWCPVMLDVEFLDQATGQPIAMTNVDVTATSYPVPNLVNGDTDPMGIVRQNVPGGNTSLDIDLINPYTGLPFTYTVKGPIPCGSVLNLGTILVP